MTEELEQLLKNLKLRRMLSVYDEQLQAAEKAQIPYTEFVAGLLRTQWHERQESVDERRRGTPTLSGDKVSNAASLVVKMAHSTGESAGAMVAGDVSVVAPAGREPQADAHVRRTRLRGEA